ncbi:hypothetical protein NDU88_003437 [Pleurodeles waltl]|uniref:Uncharacterized protein n=1 Tax=Pleurodeles waltl TaxID=8319 RepID=A0AAV7WST9_PLEWA|nr:hypothetical protein NDU88_003437 [Pleurodeles waltl]
MWRPVTPHVSSTGLLRIPGKGGKQLKPPTQQSMVFKQALLEAQPPQEHRWPVPSPTSMKGISADTETGPTALHNRLRSTGHNPRPPDVAKWKSIHLATAPLSSCCHQSPLSICAQALGPSRRTPSVGGPLSPPEPEPTTDVCSSHWLRSQAIQINLGGT